MFGDHDHSAKNVSGLCYITSGTQTKVGNGSVTPNILDGDTLLKYLQGHIHTLVRAYARARTHTYLNI